MSTHHALCVVCGRETLCSHDESALGSGRKSPCDFTWEEFQNPANRVGVVEFCSINCFLELREAMTVRMAVTQKIYPELFEGRDLTPRIGRTHPDNVDPEFASRIGLSLATDPTSGAQE